MPILPRQPNGLSPVAPFLGFPAIFFLGSGQALADGMPQNWGMTLQVPGTGIDGRIYDFHQLLLVIISGVVLLVLALLITVMVRYGRTRNPVPSRTTHHLKLELVWTLIPCLIVLGIAWISFPLLYDMDRMPPPDLTLKVTGHQWYWSYEYPDRDGLAFDSTAIWDAFGPSEDQTRAAIKDASAHWLIKNEPMRLLEVDHRVVLPVGKVVRVQITGGDVLHSWYISSLGINRMAVVGRLNEVWFKIDKPGVYYGECSMICGNGHGFMPIVIEGVPQEQFDLWAAAQKAASNQGASHSTPSQQG